MLLDLFKSGAFLKADQICEVCCTGESDRTHSIFFQWGATWKHFCVYARRRLFRQDEDGNLLLMCSCEEDTASV